MVKNKICEIISNTKFSIGSLKISLDAIKGFFILTINNKYSKTTLILQFLLRVWTSNIGVSSYFFCCKVENLNSNNINNKSKIKKEIKLHNKINWDILIY